MNQNYFAFLKLKTYEKNIQAKELAIDTKRNEGYISRILNYKISNPDEETLIAIENSLGLNQQEIRQENSKFQQLFSQYMATVYAIERETREQLYNEIIHFEGIKNTPYVIPLLLTQYIQKIIRNEYNDDFNQLDNKLMHIHQSMEEEEKEIFIVFHFGALVSSHKYQDVEKYIPAVNTTKPSHYEIEMVKDYYLFSYYSHIGLSIKCLNYYEECVKWCKKTNSIKRLFNLEIIYTNYLMQFHLYDQAIQKNLELLELSKQYYDYNYLTLLNNVAWGYMLSHQYEQALPYYLEGVKTDPNTDQFFHIAWCYYKLKDKKHVRQFIAAGKKLDEQSYHMFLLEWLEAMVNKPYSKKCINILEKIVRIYKSSLDEDIQNFVLIQLEDYYYHTKEYEKAHEISRMLINKYCPSVA